MVFRKRRHLNPALLALGVQDSSRVTCVSTVDALAVKQDCSDCRATQMHIVVLPIQTLVDVLEAFSEVARDSFLELFRFLDVDEILVDF